MSNYRDSHSAWDNLSMAERLEVMKLALQEGINNLDDIRNAYNSFESGGSKSPKTSYIYDVLPEMLRNAGLNVRVTSGYRKAGAVGTAGSKSWHPRHGAVDIVPQGNTTFEDIERVVTTNPEIIKYMTDNGFGFLDETNRTAAGRALMKKTGATGNHFHFGKDTSARNRYQSLLGNVAAIQPVSTQESVYTPSQATLAAQPALPYTLPVQEPVQVYAPNPLPTPDLGAIEEAYQEKAARRNRQQALTSFFVSPVVASNIEPPVAQTTSFLDHPMLQFGNGFSEGGSIHIAPSKRGTFTAAAKKHGKSVQAFASQVLAHPENYSPAMRKKANFARNSRKWKHADGGPLVDTANAHIYDGTTEDSQQMNDDYIFTGRPSQYDFQVTAKAPTVYWDGFNWIGFNDLGQRVTKGPNFNPSGARIIENPQEFENARLAQAQKKDINRTHEFGDMVREFTTDLVMLPAGDVLAEPIGILGNKLGTSFIKSKPVKQAAKKLYEVAGWVEKKRNTPSILNDAQQAKTELGDFLRSDAYKDRFLRRVQEKYNRGNPIDGKIGENVQNAILDDIDYMTQLMDENKVKVDYLKGALGKHQPTTKTIIIDPKVKYTKDLGRQVAKHEYVHSTDFPYIEELNSPLNIKALPSSDNPEYFSKPTEIRARFLNVASDMQKEGFPLNYEGFEDFLKSHPKHKNAKDIWKNYSIDDIEKGIESILGLSALYKINNYD